MGSSSTKLTLTSADYREDVVAIHDLFQVDVFGSYYSDDISLLDYIQFV